MVSQLNHTPAFYAGVFNSAFAERCSYQDNLGVVIISKSNRNE